MSELANKVQNALALIGRKNGTAYPYSSQDPIDTLLHNLFVDKLAKAFFTKQCDETQEAVLEFVAGDNINRLVELTKKHNVGQSDTLLNSENYSLILETKKGAEAFDKKVMRNELIKAGVDQKIIDACYEKATKQNAPAKSFKVVQS